MIETALQLQQTLQSTLSPAKSRTRTHPDHEVHGKVEEEGGAVTGSF